ncbi:MAG: prepilin-type N-terminal cleavage/methylation domain-containing protein [Clostridia bacterium]|nr:prepilin-type N-terminal cleavage/methylation domain-containing protein [Clostridia bacterium]
MRKNKKGFTLVELVIVIAVIAILAAVLLPTFATVIENAKVSSATQKANNALKDYFTRVATLSTTDQVDVIGDLKDYILIVENGAGKVDYKFVVQADGSLSAAVKGTHDGTKFTPNTVTAEEVEITLTNMITVGVDAGAVKIDGAATGVGGLNGVVIYQHTATNTVNTPLA